MNYREAYNMYACNGILFNHESPRRGGTFVTKKVTANVAQIMAGQRDRILLGNMDSLRDWGHARDYVKAMWMMLQQEKPEDYVVSTGRQYSVRQFCTLCFEMVGKRIQWRGTGIEEEGVDQETNQVLVQVSEKYFRPAEVETLLGDMTKLKTETGWNPDTSFKALIYEMMEYDMTQQGLEMPAGAKAVRDRTGDEYC